MNQKEVEERLVDDREFSRIAGVSVHSARRWRRLGTGPRFLKLSENGAVKYRPRDIAAWLDSRATGGEGAAPASERQSMSPRGTRAVR